MRRDEDHKLPVCLGLCGHDQLPALGTWSLDLVCNGAYLWYRCCSQLVAQLCGLG